VRRKALRERDKKWLPVEKSKKKNLQLIVNHLGKVAQLGVARENQYFGQAIRLGVE